MTNFERTTDKIHYICQTYVEKKAGGNGQGGLKIAKQLNYATASEAKNRAEREVLSEDCAGADAYMVSEDPNSGEVGEPSFLLRLGKVPEFDTF